MGTLQPVFARVTQRWMEFMVQTGETPGPLPSSTSPPTHIHTHIHTDQDFFAPDPGCTSVSKSSTHMVSRFLLSSILSEFTTLVTSMAGDTSVRIFEQHL